ncbi:MAG: VOC family protein [Caldimonas sp.]
MTEPAGYGAVIFAKDVGTLARFYSELLSMAVVHSARDHVVLEVPGCQLVVHAIPARVANTIEITAPPALRTQTPIKLFFRVASLADARARAASLGGGLSPADKEWEARGFRACDGHDPEGNVLQLRQGRH